MFQSTLPTRGSDPSAPHRGNIGGGFQSTLPTRGSDITLTANHQSLTAVSIHAPHEGERQVLHFSLVAHGMFQSTLPTRGSDLPKIV